MALEASVPAKFASRCHCFQQCVDPLQVHESTADVALVAQENAHLGVREMLENRCRAHGIHGREGRLQLFKAEVEGASGSHEQLAITIKRDLWGLRGRSWRLPRQSDPCVDRAIETQIRLLPHQCNQKMHNALDGNPMQHEGMKSPVQRRLIDAQKNMQGR